MTALPRPETPTIDNYVIGACIGEGGFGTVYRGVHAKLDRPVAIKVLHHDYGHDPIAVARFEAEARAANKVQHPSIVRVYDFGRLADGRSYYVMELLTGRTLRELLDVRGALPFDEARPILHKLAEAIDAAHAAGVAHRDLKPENLFLEANGSVRVIDFGLAKLAGDERVTTTGRIMGTPLYMSPEQCRGKDIDTRTDLYSFGAVAYHALVGEPPFSGDPLTLALHHINDEPPRPSSRNPRIPPELDTVLLALLDKDPKRRPRPLAPLIDALGTTTPEPAARRGRRGALAIGCLATAALASFTVVRATRSTARPTPPADDWKLVETLSNRPFAANLSMDGDALVIIGEEDSTRRELATGATSTVAHGHAGWFPDGRELVLSRAGVSLVARDAPPILLSSSSDLAWSSKLDRLGFIEDKTVIVYDVATGTRRRVGTVDNDDAGLNMSPNGARLIWNLSGGKLRVVDVDDDRSSRVLQLPAVAKASGAGAAFVDDDHIAYCTDEGDKRAIRIRHLDPVGDLGTKLHDLDPFVTDCYTIAHRGRLLVTAVYGRPQLARLVDGKLEPLGLPPGTVLEASDGHSLAIASGARRERYDTVTRTREARTCHVPLATGSYETTPAPSGTALAIYDDACKPVGVWTFAPKELASPPACRGTHCVVAVRAGASTRIVRLAPGSAPQRFAEAPVAAPADPLRIDISDDGERVAIVAPDNASFGIYELGRGGSREPDIVGHAFAAVYDARGRLVISVHGDAGYSVFAYVDDKLETLWAAERQSFTVLGRTADAIVGELVDKRLDTFLFARVRRDEAPLRTGSR